MSQWQEGNLIKPSCKTLWARASCSVVYSEEILTWSAGPWMWSASPQCLWFWLGSSGHPAELGCRWPGISCPSRLSSWGKGTKKKDVKGWKTKRRSREKTDGGKERERAGGGGTSGRNCVRSIKVQGVANNSQHILKDNSASLPETKLWLKVSGFSSDDYTLRNLSYFQLQ